MRNKFFIVSFLSILLFTACKKEIGTNNTPEEIASATANRASPKITVCHYDAITGKNKTILINETAWPAHQAHGDVLGDCSAVFVKICDQYWMNKNLDVSTYRNGDLIPQVTDPTEWAGLTTGAWCYYNNDPANGAIYGKLYNWYAVNDIRGLAPAGWHIPTDAEWTVLCDCLGGESIAGGAMKATTYWQSPNTGATNSSGFTGLPGGYRPNDGSFNFIGVDGIWWSSSEINSFDAWHRYLYYIHGGLIRFYGDKRVGFSVRCLRD